MVTGPAASDEWPEFARALGRNLRRLRDERRLTQDQMAERVGISLYAYQQYERGAITKNGAPTNPRIATLLAVAQALEVPLQDLLPEVPPLTAPR